MAKGVPFRYLGSMALTHSEPVQLGIQAPPFRLRGVDGAWWTLENFKSTKGLLVAFICNHCPYVIAIQERLAKLADTVAPHGIATIAINSNDPIKYPDDAFDAMKVRADQVGYRFPYVQDDTQTVARAYGAVCTPDFFLFRTGADGSHRLAYRGRMDDSWKDATQVKKRDLEHAMMALVEGAEVDPVQHSSMGCSIKWK